MKLSRLHGTLTVLIGLAITAVVVVAVHVQIRNQALLVAEKGAHAILDRDLAAGIYFEQTMRPKIEKILKMQGSSDYFDPMLLSGTFINRCENQIYQEISATDYSFRKFAVNARNPEHEADNDERRFLYRLNTEPELIFHSTRRRINGEPYLVFMHRGGVMEESCLECHGEPSGAPPSLVAQYGAERGFYRKVGDVVSASSISIPLKPVLAAVNQFTLQLSLLLVGAIAVLCFLQYWLNRRLIYQPLERLRYASLHIANHPRHVGDQIPLPSGEEMAGVTRAFNLMSANLKNSRNESEQFVVHQLKSLQREIEGMKGDIAEQKEKARKM